jgi:hypothetical protein
MHNHCTLIMSAGSDGDIRTLLSKICVKLCKLGRGGTAGPAQVVWNDMHLVLRLFVLHKLAGTFGMTLNPE